MKITAKMLGAVFVLAVPLTARPKTDVIVLANGDRLTGEIKGLDAGILKVDLDYVDGTLSIQWLKVARVDSKQLFIVQAADGSLYTGTLATSPSRPTDIEISGAGATATVEQSQVVRVEQTAESFIRRWSGELDVGLLYSKGNNAIQNNFGSLVEYQREQWGVQAGFNSSLSSNSGSETSTRNQVDVSGYRLAAWKNYFYGGYGSFMQSSVQGISLQTTLGGGFGRFLKNTNRMRFSLLGGLAWQSIEYGSPTATAPNQQVAAGLIATSLRVFVFKKTNLAINAYLLPAFTDSGRLHFNTNASYYLKMFKNLNWNLSFYGNWDTQPPAHFSGSDYGYSSGLRWTFGNR